MVLNNLADGTCTLLHLTGSMQSGYNAGKLSQLESITMPLGGDNPLSGRRMFSVRNATIFVVILAITFSLASRVFHGQVFSTHVVHSSAHQLVQHRDTDAVEWVPPVCTLTLLWSTEDSLVVEPSEPFYPHEQFQSLYNRPPPIS